MNEFSWYFSFFLYVFCAKCIQFFFFSTSFHFFDIVSIEYSCAQFFMLYFSFQTWKNKKRRVFHYIPCLFSTRIPCLSSQKRIFFLWTIFVHFASTFPFNAFFSFRFHFWLKNFGRVQERKSKRKAKMPSTTNIVQRRIQIQPTFIVCLCIHFFCHFSFASNRLVSSIE